MLFHMILKIWINYLNRMKKGNWNNSFYKITSIQNNNKKIMMRMILVVQYQILNVKKAP